MQYDKNWYRNKFIVYCIFILFLRKISLFIILIIFYLLKFLKITLANNIFFLLSCGPFPERLSAALISSLASLTSSQIRSRSSANATNFPSLIALVRTVLSFKQYSKKTLNCNEDRTLPFWTFFVAFIFSSLYSRLLYLKRW